MKLKKLLSSWRNLAIYELYGRKPWTRGYFEHKWKLIEEVLSGEIKLTELKNERIDERIVEYPWLIEHLPAGKALLLDAGSALNFEIILNQSKLADKKITIANLNPEKNSFSKRGVGYLFEDIRKLPLLDDTFDIVTCISTLEHVGMDNSIYIGDEKYREKSGDYMVAAQELKRVLKPGGSLFVTVPYGKYSDHGFFQQFDAAMIGKLKNLFNTTKEDYFKFENGSWHKSSAEQCASAEYVTADKARESAYLPAAASAVACLKLTK